MKQIAFELNLSRQTAARYRSELARKLNARTDISIYIAAVERGLITPRQAQRGRGDRAPKHVAAKLAKLRRYPRSFSRQRNAAASKPLPKGTRIEA